METSAIQPQELITDFVKKYQKLDLKRRKYWFRYTSTGNKRASKKMGEIELKIRKLTSDRERFAQLKKFYEQRHTVADRKIRRQVELLYAWHLENQVSEKELEKLTKLEREIQEIFNDYRPLVDGKRLAPTEVTKILTESSDSVQLEKVWKAHKLVGSLLEQKYRELVMLRNKIARGLGFENYLGLSATVREFDPKMLEKFYRDVTRVTELPFRKLKRSTIDPKLAKHYGITVKELKPWHYQNAYFQEAPNAIFDQIDLDRFYTHVDAHQTIERMKTFYASMGIDVGPIVKRSSLFPKEGKNPHAVAWFLDPRKSGSSLMSMNLPAPPEAPKASQVSTLVHEISHDINYEAILANRKLPYLLREPTMLTEAVAMLFEEQTRTADWFRQFGASKEEAEKAVKEIEFMRYVDQLLFLRWATTIYCFETQFYADPTRDISDLWWSCKEKYQLLKRPEGWKNPDALAKYHIPNITPFQYSNYALGQVANVQFTKLLASKIGASPQGASYFGQMELGRWLMTDFLAQGELYRWDEFIELSTGEPLSVKAWKEFYLSSRHHIHTNQNQSASK